LSALWPTAAETSTLRFLLPFGSLRSRVAFAVACAAAGLLVWAVMPLRIAPVGLVAVLIAHLLVWVRTVTTAPGGATPQHEDLWAPVEDDWLAKVTELEKRGERWDTTPWDITNVIGCLTFVVLIAVLVAGTFVVSPWLDGEAIFRLLIGGAVVLLPLWLNGIRTTWNPSELRRKGDALAVARETAVALAKGEFDCVPTLALREGRRGKYPVDARLMLRPAREDESGFLGVQVQVAMNNVRGTDYPYLYAVVLGKGAFELPDVHRRTAEGVDLVFEKGEGEGVRYLVVRQHADTKGGWHTEPHHIAGIVAQALELGRQAWRMNQPAGR
jgi:hypothetical protein